MIVHRRVALSRLLASLLFVLALGASGCALVQDTSKQDASPTVPPDVAAVKVVALGFSDQFDAQDHPVNLRNVLPAGVDRIGAYVLLENVKPGMTVEGRWFELGAQDPAPDGTMITQSSVVLTADAIDPGSSRASAFFTLNTDRASLPEDSWLLRVYVEGHLVRTAAVIISNVAGNVQFQTTPTPSPAPETATPAPVDTPAQ